MKKRIINAMLLVAIATTGAIANETKDFDLKSNYKNTNEIMNDIKTKMPLVYDIVSDYFQAKICKEDVAKTVSVKEIRNFLLSDEYGFLLGFKYQGKESPIMKANYDVLINGYKVINCGSLEAMHSYADAISAMTVEMNANQVK